MSSEVGADRPRRPARMKNERRALEYRFGDTQHPPLLAAGVLASLHVRLSQPEGNRPLRRIGLLGRYSVRQPVPHFEAGYGSAADTVKLFKQSHHAFFEDEVCQMGFPASCVRPREPLVPIQSRPWIDQRFAPNNDQVLQPAVADPLHGLYEPLARW